MPVKRSLVLLSLAACLALAVVPASPGKDGDVLVSGTCSGASSSKLKLSEEDGRIEVEFEVDQNRNGVRWNVTLRRGGGQLLFSGTRVTRGPSGSFEVRRVVDNRPGNDTIRARATRSGGLCRATATWRA